MDNENKTVAAPVEPDLEKARDEKCIPIAKAILDDMSTMLIPEDANVKVDYNPILKSMLQKMLDADTNIAMENPYIFQLILGVFAGLNRTTQSCAVLPIDDVRYGKIASQILSILVKGNVRIGNVKQEDVDADFVPIKDELNVLFATEKLTLMELKYVMDNIFTSFNDVQTLFNTNVAQSSEKAESKLFGIENMNDLSMKKLDEVLKKE